MSVCLLNIQMSGQAGRQVGSIFGYRWDLVALKRAILVTQCMSDRCRWTPVAAGWLRQIAPGSRLVFSALAWRCEPERLASASDSGAAGETAAAVTCLVNVGGRWRSGLATVLFSWRKRDRGCRSQSQRHIATDGRSVSTSWLFLLVRKLLSCPYEAHSLTRRRICHLSESVSSNRSVVSIYKVHDIYN
jgi:hypothetical protein